MGSPGLFCCPREHCPCAHSLPRPRSHLSSSSKRLSVWHHPKGRCKPSQQERSLLRPRWPGASAAARGLDPSSNSSCSKLPLAVPSRSPVPGKPVPTMLRSPPQQPRSAPAHKGAPAFPMSPQHTRRGHRCPRGWPSSHSQGGTATVRSQKQRPPLFCGARLPHGRQG